MTDRISKAAEAKIIEALDEARQLMDEGLVPNEAIVKAAALHDLPAGHVRLMVQAYNTAETNNTRKNADDVFEKAGEFELADADSIIKNLFPTVSKTAGQAREQTEVSPEYASPPHWWRESVSREKASRHVEVVKTASAYDRDPIRETKAAHAILESARREEQELRREVSAHRDKLAAKFEALENYFRTPGSIPFEEVSENASALWGKTAAQLMAKIGEASKCFAKRAGYNGPTPVQQNKAPYSYIRGCLSAIDGYHAKSAALAGFRDQTRGPLQKVARRFAPPIYSGCVDLEEIMAPVKKAAEGGPQGFVPNLVGSALGSTAGTEIAGKMLGKSTDSLKEDTFKSITDPAHEAKIRSIQTQAALHDMMANDPVISGHQPEDVLRIYNEVQQLAPRVAQNSMLMRALIRKHLAQGQLDSFDLNQLTGIESNLQGRDNSNPPQPVK